MNHPPDRPPSPRAWSIVLVTALLFTLLDAIKPLHIDDPFILRVAEQVRDHPLDPYGFDIFWYQWPQPVFEELTPPVLPYWWSLGLRLLGDRPFAWKLWMFPFSLVFCGSVFLLLRRFARGVELPLTVMTALSPAFLPSLNLMQDIPAQGLGLLSLVLYLRASDRGSWTGAVAAGIAAGLAAQTKYTTLTVLAAMLVHAVLHRRIRLAALSASVAAGMFAVWEVLMTLRYGQGMFLGQVGSDLFWAPRRLMVPPLVQHLGGTLPALGLIGAAALGLDRRWVLGLGAAVLSGYVALLYGPVEGALYPLLGLGLVVVLAAACRRLLSRRPWNSTDLFLVLWLAGEVAGYFVTSPFPALRRVMGVLLASTFVLGRLAAAARRDRGPAHLPLAPLVGLGLVLGLGLCLVDLREAGRQRRAADSALALIRAEDPRPTVWFTGHWGFQFYAERNGMRPLIPDHSRVEAGDWVVVPDRVDQQAIDLPSADFELARGWSVSDFPPLVTSFGFYGGMIPVAHHPGPRLSLRIFRARQASVPRSARSVPWLLEFVELAGERQSLWAVPALCRGLGHPGAEPRLEAARTLRMLALRAERVGEPERRRQAEACLAAAGL